MSDKELIARGAEVITGDLILNRVVVGKYRNGQFIITPEGAEELQNVVQEGTKVVAQSKPRAAKRAKDAEVTDVEDKSASAELVGSLDDILKD